MDQLHHIFNVSATVSNEQINTKEKPLSSTDKKCNDLFKSFLLGFAAGGFTGAGAGTGLTAATGGLGFVAIPILTSLGAVFGGITGIVTHLFYEAIINKGNDSKTSSVKNTQENLIKNSSEFQIKNGIADLIINPNEGLEESFIKDLQRGSYKINGKEFGVADETQELSTEEAKKNKNKIQKLLLGESDLKEVKNESTQSMLNLMSFAGQKLPTLMKDILENQARDENGDYKQEYKDILNSYGANFGFYGVAENFESNMTIDEKNITYSVKASVVFGIPPGWGEDTSTINDHYIDCFAKISLPRVALEKSHDEKNKEELLSQIKIQELSFSPKYKKVQI